MDFRRIKSADLAELSDHPTRHVDFRSISTDLATPIFWLLRAWL
jgi:hypothetical protein